MNNYTIISQVTPIGYSGVGIIRISGPLSKKVSFIILGKNLKPRYVYYLIFKNLKNQIIDKGIAIWFNKPYSLTGEDILELHPHGGQLIINLLIQEILKISSDIQIAKPGEFTERAFINNKIDLLQAEAINDLIQTQSNKAINYIINNVTGCCSKFINSILIKIVNLQIEIENLLNFDQDNIYHYSLSLKIKKICFNLLKLFNNICNNKLLYINLLQKGIKLILMGTSNVGKSSIFNALLGYNRAIVTNLQGTTRDSIIETLQIDNLTISLIDTAGIRSTKNIIENLGIKKTYEEINNANYILYVIDIKQYLKLLNNNQLNKILTFKPLNIDEIYNKLIIVINKIDLIKQTSNNIIKKLKLSNNQFKSIPIICISSFNNTDITLLKQTILNKIYNDLSQNKHIKFAFRERHFYCFSQIIKHLNKINKKLNVFTFVDDIIAYELIQIKKLLEEILGKNISSNEIINNIFRKFCIGK